MEFDRSQALMDTLPAHISITQMLKATPATEGSRRIVYIEASNESRDYQNEIILSKALKESADYYMRFGNLDLEHYTQVGKPNPSKGWPGIPNCEMYEIGRPVDVRLDGKRTFVKGIIKSGTGPAAEKANLFWSSLTEVSPPEVWYPSVGGAVMERGTKLDPSTGDKIPMITKVRWTNIGFSKTPVNPDVPEVSTIPIGVLAKCWGAFGIDLRKSLAAGYATDSAAMTGGDALRAGNGDQARGGPLAYWDFRDQFSKLIHAGDAGKSIEEMVGVAGTRFQLSKADAAEYVERFMGDLNRALKEKQR